ncbi:MAG: AmmeMemoRadiSam system protein B [bacterium]|nr:AmmeMemoRadiSam system protein B [bacterium]
MTLGDNDRPKLRPVEAFPLPDTDPGMVALRDPSGLAPTALTVSEGVLFILSFFDGAHTLEQIRAEYARQFRQPLPRAQLEEVVNHFQEAHLLEGVAFEAYYRELVDEYLASPTRMMNSADELGIDRNIARIFDALMNDSGTEIGDAQVLGMIAPHLDYPRGAPCYAAAYAALRDRPVPDRVVILGTNHFGRGRGVVATEKGFETPLGTTTTDMEFVRQLEACCGDLRQFEFDHRREHSVELQVVWCQHMFGADRFSIVPLLCPDPCTPEDLQINGGNAAYLRKFTAALRECIRLEGGDTLLIASADLSHVGGHFGDERRLDTTFLPEVQQRDRRALKALEDEGAEAFMAAVAEEGNPTRICGGGCIYTLAGALPDARVQLLKYHQAVHEESQTGVTCAAALLTK